MTFLCCNLCWSLWGCNYCRSLVLWNSIRLLIVLENIILFCWIIVTRKEIVLKRCNFFCLCYVLALTSAQSFRKGTKSSGSFNNISLNIKFWKKYHLSLDYVSKYPKALLNEIVMNKANSERNSKRRKDTNEESPKKYFCL